MIPLMKTPSKLSATKLAMVDKDKKKTLGKIIGPKVCHSPCKYQDADVWLKDQPVAYQKDVLGKAFDAWKLGNISFKRMVTQKGRQRTTDELAKIYEQQSVIPKGISSLKTTEKFRPYAKSSASFKDELSKIEKGEFLKLEERLMTGQTVSRSESDKLGRIFKNAHPEDLEFKNSYNPEGFNDFLGNKAKRLAFYNHTAKRFERTNKWKKGDLELRKTGRRSEVDNRVLEEIKDKVTLDNTIPGSHKKILLEMLDESHRLVGSQRSLPMTESLLTLARKKDFSDIDDFVAYLNNSMGNAVNSYFSRVKRLEIRLTASTEKVARYNSLSENAKTIHYRELTNPDSKVFSSTSLAEANEVKGKITKIGKRRLRNFDGEKPSHLNVDLELPPEEMMDLYLTHLQDDVRMGSKSVRDWMKRITHSPSANKAEQLHQKRVEYILKRTQPGDKIVLTDSILSNPLFKEWKDEVWSGRGFPPAVREEVGKVLGDAEMYQGLKKFMSTRIKAPDSADYSEYFEKTIDKYIKAASLTRKTSKAKKSIDDLYLLDGKGREKLRVKRTKEQDKALNKEGYFAKIRRGKAKEEKVLEVEKQRLTAESDWKDMADSVYVKKTSEELDKMIIEHGARPSSPMFSQSFATRTEDVIRLSQLVNQQVLFASKKGATYIDTIKKVGERYYYQFKGITNPLEDDVLRMGHFLTESLVNTGVVKRVKSMQTILKPGLPPREVLTWRLDVADKKWADAILANKRNYEVDGLPVVGKSPKVGSDGLYKTGQKSIKGSDAEWLEKQSKSRKSKPWIDNLNTEAKTGIKVNGYIYDVMSEMEKKGKGIIPKKPIGVKDESLLSQYNSYQRARDLARSLRDDTFYNRLANDRYSRTYADTVALHWQGDDVNRSLMQFAKGVKLGKNGLKDFKRNFMNVAGFDKLPMKTRVDLFDKIPDQLILDTVKDPIKNDWWFNTNDWLKTGILKNTKGLDSRDISDIKKLASKADPSGEGAFQFLAMIQERSEMIAWTKSGKKIQDFKSHLPSQRDGTTNVLQHFAGISRDQKIAESVNMVVKREVSDAYIQLRDAMDDIGRAMDPNDPLKKYIDVSGLSHAKRRKSVKKALMTSQYNAGPATLGESYFDALKDVQVKGKFIFREASLADKKAIGHMINKASENHFPEATKVRHLLNNLAEAHEISGKDAIEIRTPLGFPFRQSYKKSETRQVELPTSTGSIKLEVRVDLDELDYPKQNRAFAPNIIHAMDATHKSLVVNNLNKKYGITDFSMIHDSFGSHYGSMDLLLKETRSAFLEMYQGKNFMRYLYDEFKKQGITMKRFVRNEKGMKVKDKSGEYLVEDIPLSEIESLGKYNFKDFDNLEYFFH